MSCITEDGTTYTAWPLSGLPDWMLADAPDRAACLVMKNSGTVIGWIDADCAGPGQAWNLPGEFVRLVTAAHGRVSLEGSTALLVYPKGAVNVAVPRPGVSLSDFRHEVLGCHAITRTELGGLLALCTSADGDDDAQQLNLAATPLARQFGFAQRRMRGPVMLCQIGGDGGGMTIRQLIGLLTQPLTVSPRTGGELAAATAVRVSDGR